MATRPAWTIINNRVEERSFEFVWNSGFAISQKRRNIAALHNNIYSVYHQKALEISTKSEIKLGNELSAFNLRLNGVLLECIFQSSKQFENGGPFIDLIETEPKLAKRDERLKTSGKLIAFVYNGVTWELTPKTAFYDYIYIKALIETMGEELDLNEYDWFTDIEFNPNKSVNCQARALTLYKLMQKEKAFDRLEDVKEYLLYHREKVR